MPPSCAPTLLPLLTAIGLCVFVAGCFGRVALPAPPDDEGKRAEWREQMAPRARSAKTTVYVALDDAGSELRRTKTTRDVLVLHRGEVIRYPEDLIVVLGEQHDCSRLARLAADRRWATDIWGGAGAILIGTSVVTFVLPPEPFPLAPLPLVLGGAGIGSLVVMAMTNGAADAARDVAFTCYEEDYGKL